MCKKLKVSPEPYVLRHYMNGEFHKLYDRKETAASMISFMRNPTGDVPWEEDEETLDVVHLPDPGVSCFCLEFNELCQGTHCGT